MQNGQKNSSVVPIIVGIAAILILALSGIMIGLALTSDSDSNSGNSNPVVTTTTGEKIDEHARGKLDSDVVVMEYADMQCPGCAAMMPVMEKMYKKYGDRVKFVYRHYPLNGHKNAKAASTAVEAAGRQGYFWEMLSAVFDNQGDWGYKSGDKLTSAFVDIFKTASKGKGDADRFVSDLGDTAIAEKIDNDKQLGVEMNIRATPTIIVDGESVELSTQDITEAIEKALNK